MNVLAREYHLPRHDLATAWQRIIAGPQRTLDVWQAGDWPFLQMAGLGLDADVVRSTPWSLKKRWGALSYGLTLHRLMKKSLPRFEITLDDQQTLTAQAVLCGNGTFYGGSIGLFPDAQPDDGLLDVLIAHHIDWPLIARLTLDGLRHDPFTYPPRTSRHRVKKITLTTSDTLIPYECDGESAGTSPVTIHLANWKVILRGVKK
jgi:diacylglycerol kinase family enzyme